MRWRAASERVTIRLMPAAKSAKPRSLSKYHEKRNFQASPEPKGDAKIDAKARAKAKELFFCVQKHLASHLHYDFRLEHRGVLLSWAVPKGPSLDPSVKRLAMHVEDHPIEYGDFEGVIPEGYGAGVVMLWDYGTWQPEVDDVEAALAKGDLKMRLDGFKLKGSWVLVRTRSWGRQTSTDDGRSWLLIKHKDEWSGELDITDFAPKSVKSDGMFRDILAQKAPSVWLSNRGAASAPGESSLETLSAILTKLDAIEPLEPDTRTPDAPVRRTAARKK